MVRAIATVGYMGYLPRVGGLVSTALGLGLAVTLFLLTQSGSWMMVGWCFVFAATAWALPRALQSAQVGNDTIVIDRIAGIWLASAPAIPVVYLALQVGPLAVLAVLATPLVAFHLILMGPLRRMGASARPWLRLGDDLIAGGIVMVLTLGVMTTSLVRLGDSALP